MKKLLIPAVVISSALAAQAQFTAGDLVVLEDGTGATLNSASTAVFLDEYTTAGALQSGATVTIPTSGASELTISGTAASEGQLSLSANDQYLVLGGYNVAPGVASISGTASSADPRALGTVNANGTFSLAVTTSTSYSLNNMRGGTTDGNGNFWGAGPGGTVYMGTGTPAQISTVNSVSIQDIGNNLYYSTAKGTEGIYEISGTPTSGTATPSLLMAVSNPSDFTFNTSMTIAYVAVTTGGIERWTYNGSIWVLGYTLDIGTDMNALAVDFSGANPIVYATTESGSTLLDITDTGSGSAATTLATASTGEDFRGLDFAPTPEPSTFALAGMGIAALGFFRRNRKA